MNTGSYITKQPVDLTIQRGESFTLSVEVSIPDGVEVEYLWYMYTPDYPYEGATAADLHLGPDDPGYPPPLSSSLAQSSSKPFRCRITAYEKDSSGNVVSTRTLTSQRVDVVVENVKDNSFLGKLYKVIVAPFIMGAEANLSFVVLGAFWPIVFFPITYPFFYIFFLFVNIIGLFK